MREPRRAAREKEEVLLFDLRAVSMQENDPDSDPCLPANQQGWTLEEPTTLGTAKRILFIDNLPGVSF